MRRVRHREGRWGWSAYWLSVFAGSVLSESLLDGSVFAGSDEEEEEGVAARFAGMDGEGGDMLFRRAMVGSGVCMCVCVCEEGGTLCKIFEVGGLVR